MVCSKVLSGEWFVISGFEWRLGGLDFRERGIRRLVELKFVGFVVYGKEIKFYFKSDWKL